MGLPNQFCRETLRFERPDEREYEDWQARACYRNRSESRSREEPIGDVKWGENRIVCSGRKANGMKREDARSRDTMRVCEGSRA